MPIKPPQDHATYREWLFLAPDGEISSAERTELERHLTSCRECRVERRQIDALGGLLDSSRVPVDPALVRRVLEQLPQAGWEARNPQTWRWGVAALLLFSAAAALIGWVTPVAGSSPPALLAALNAVVALFASAAVAGAGLLSASWQGLGLALGEIFGGSKLTLGVFGLFVLGVDILFIRFLLSRPKPTEAAVERNDR